MFEARFDQGALLQKLIAALGEVIVDANFDADSSGISVQAMDTSHTCLVSAQIKADALAHFRADRPLTLGLNLPNLVKVLKCAGKDDAIALRAADDAGTLALQRDWAKANGVDPTAFTNAWNSMSVDVKLRQADDLVRRYRVEGTPAMIINGKYFTDTTSAGGVPQMLELINALVASETRR